MTPRQLNCSCFECDSRHMNHYTDIRVPMTDRQDLAHIDFVGEAFRHQGPCDHVLLLLRQVLARLNVPWQDKEEEDSECDRECTLATENCRSFSRQLKEPRSLSRHNR